MHTTAPSPSSAPGPVARPVRSLTPDLARGLMLALIAIANVSWLLWGHGSVGMTPHVPAQTLSDQVLQFLMTIMVDHRALPLFAFLFGYGMVQFYRSRIDRGIPPQIVRIMMRRRHWGMILLGLLHAALLFYGDILGAYGLAAVLLVWIFFDRRDRTLRIWICVIAAITTLFALFSLFGGVMTTLFTPDDVLAEMAAGTQAFSPELLRDLAYAQSYPVTVLVRAGLWVPTTIQGALTMVVPLAIMLGWLAARHRVLDEPWNHVPMLRRLAIGGIALGWLTGLPDALMIAGLLPLPEAVYWMFAGMNYLGGLICGLGYAAAFALLAMRLEGRTAHPGPAPVTGPAEPESSAVTSPVEPEPSTLAPAQLAYGVAARTDGPAPGRSPGPLPRALSAVGQRSLTFYLLQSVLLVPLMAAWGLGIAAHISTTGAVAIAFVVWLLCLPIASVMDARGMRGPAERLLRAMTYGKHDPRPGRAHPR